MTATPRDAIAASPLAIQGLTVSYHQKPAVFSLDFVTEPGCMTAIVGPNGAGKSTLLKATLGIVTPLAGEIRRYGVPDRQGAGRIAYVPQRSSVDWDFPATVLDVVVMW